MTEKVYPVGDAVHPVEASKAGRNRYYHFCSVTQKHEHYGICLFVQDAVQRKQQLSYTECVHAVECGMCPAQKMRQEEIEAGRALYFVPHVQIEEVTPEERPKPTLPKVDYNSPSYLRGRYGPNYLRPDQPTPAPVTPAPKTQPAPVRKVPKQEDVVQMDFAKMVSDLVQEEKAKPVPAPEKKIEAKPQVGTIKPLPGESPIEFARRRKQLLAQANNN